MFCQSRSLTLKLDMRLGVGGLRLDAHTQATDRVPPVKPCNSRCEFAFVLVFDQRDFLDIHDVYWMKINVERMVSCNPMAWRKKGRKICT